MSATSSARRDVIKERLQAIRAARSCERNRILKAKVEARLKMAQSRLESYFLLNGVTSMRLGDYQVELRDGEFVITKLPPDGWEQLELEGVDAKERDHQEKKDTGH